MTKLRQTQGRDLKNGEDCSTSSWLRDKINEILEKVPDEFENEENLSEILKLVLDQELQAISNF
jgi:hypothetical protein